MYYVKTRLSNIALNPEKMYISQIIFAADSKQHKTTVDESPNVAVSPQMYVSSVFSLLSQLLFFATNLKCQLWLSE